MQSPYYELLLLVFAFVVTIGFSIRAYKRGQVDILEFVKDLHDNNFVVYFDTDLNEFRWRRMTAHKFPPNPAMQEHIMHRGMTTEAALAFLDEIKEAGEPL